MAEPGTLEPGSIGPLLSVRDLRLTAGTRPILDGVDWSLEQAARVALVGSSGAGKTSLALASLGVRPPGTHLYSAQHMLFGRAVGELGDARLRALRRGRVAYVAQDPGVSLRPTTRIGRMLDEAAPRPHQEVLLDALGLAGLDRLRRRYVWELSGGQQRRLALTLALATGPQLLVLDEPTAGLDLRTRDEVVALLAEITATTRAAVVVITHDAEVASRLTDRSIHLADGRIVPTGGTTATARRPLRGTGAGVHVTGLTVAPARRIPATIQDASLELPTGTLTALVGPERGGKSTLVRALVGLADVRAGTVQVAGRRLPPLLQQRDRAERRLIQWVPQDSSDGLNPEVPVGMAVDRSWAGGDRRARTRALISELGLPEDCLERRPAALSGGQRQRVLLARVLAVEPRALLCDEVTSALDADSRERVLAALERRAAAGASVLLVTHDEAGVVAACGHRLEIDAGQVRLRA